MDILRGTLQKESSVKCYWFQIKKRFVCYGSRFSFFPPPRCLSPAWCQIQTNILLPILKYI